MIYSTWMVLWAVLRGLAFANNLLRFKGSQEQFVSDFNLLLSLYIEGGKAHVGYGVSSSSCCCGK